MPTYSTAACHAAMDAFFDQQFNNIDKMTSNHMNKLYPGSSAQARQPSYIPKNTNNGNGAMRRSASAGFARSNTAAANQNTSGVALSFNSPKSTGRRSASAAIPQSARSVATTTNNTNNERYERLRSEALTRNNLRQVSGSTNQVPPPVRSANNSRRNSVSVMAERGTTRRPSVGGTSSVGLNNNESISTSQQLQAQPATMFPASKVGRTLKKKKKIIKKEQEEEEEEDDKNDLHQARAKSPFFVESDIHRGKHYKRVPSPRGGRGGDNNSLQRSPSAPVAGGTMRRGDELGDLSDIQHHNQRGNSPLPLSSEQYQQHQQPNTARSTTVGGASITTANRSRRSRSPHNATDAAEIHPSAAIIIPEKDIPQHYQHVHNVREMNESKIARCLRSGWKFSELPTGDPTTTVANANNKHSGGGEHVEAGIPMMTEEEQVELDNLVVADDDEIRVATQEEKEAYLAQKRKERLEQQQQAPKNSTNAYSRENSATVNNNNNIHNNNTALPPRGSIMQCFLEDPPAPTFSVAGGRKAHRSQLNFLPRGGSSNRTSPPNNNNGTTIDTSVLSATNQSKLMYGEGRSRVFVAAVDDDHVAVAISPRNNRGQQQQEKDKKQQNVEEEEKREGRDSPPATILSSPRYDNRNLEDLFATSPLLMLSHNNKNGNGNDTTVLDDQSVIDLYSNHRPLVDAAEVVLRFTASDFCDMYRHVFCSKDAEKYKLPRHKRSALENQEPHDHQEEQDFASLQRTLLIPLAEISGIESGHPHQRNNINNNDTKTAKVVGGAALSPVAAPTESDDHSLYNNTEHSERIRKQQQEQKQQQQSQTVNNNNIVSETSTSEEPEPREQLQIVSSPLLSDFSSVGRSGGHHVTPASGISVPNNSIALPSNLIANTTNSNNNNNASSPSQQKTSDDRDCFRHHGIAFAYNYGDLNENPDGPSPITAYQQQQQQQHPNDSVSYYLPNNSHQHHHVSPTLRRLMELNGLTAHRYAVLTTAWCAFWCTSVAMDLPCISAYRKYTSDIILPRRPSLKEMQCEYFGGVTVSDADSRWSAAHPKECTIGLKVLSATREFTANVKNNIFTRAHTVRLDSALQHSLRWILDVAMFEEEEKQWREENHVPLSPTTLSGVHDANPEGQQNENGVVTSSALPPTLEDALDRVTAKDSTDLHTLLIAKALLKWCWEIRQAAIRLLEH